MINLENKKCILAYGLNNNEIVELTRRKMRHIIIKPYMIDSKVKDIIDGKITACNEEEIDQKIILFNSYEPNKLQKAVKDIRKFIKGGIVAVVTDTSKEWKFRDLLDHLVEENKWFKDNM